MLGVLVKYTVGVDNTNRDCLQVLRDQFIELYSQPILEQLRNSIIARHPELEIPEIPERGDLDLEQIKHSTYFFA